MPAPATQTNNEQKFFLTKVMGSSIAAWCVDAEWHAIDRCAYQGDATMYRCPKIKTWGTLAGAQRWLNSRPLMKDYAVVSSGAA